MAANDRDSLYLGVEVHEPGIGRCLNNIHKLQLNNVRLIKHDAVEVLQQMIDASSLDRILLFFPDPWHKKRHNKRRLIQGPFIEKLLSRLKPGGYLHCATDWPEYADQMLQELSHCGLLKNQHTGFAPRPEWRPLTKFEARGLRLGHPVADLVFRRA